MTRRARLVELEPQILTPWASRPETRTGTALALLILLTGFDFAPKTPPWQRVRLTAGKRRAGHEVQAGELRWCCHQLTEVLRPSGDRSDWRARG